MAAMHPARMRQWAPARTFSRTVMFWNRRMVWNVRAMPFSTMVCVGSPTRFCPSKSTVPVLGW